MRKILSIFLVLTCLIAVLAGCGTTKEPASNNNTVATTPNEQTKPSEPTDETEPSSTTPTTTPDDTVPGENEPEITEPTEQETKPSVTEPTLDLPEGFIYNLESFDVDNLKEFQEKTTLQHQTGNSTGSAYLSFDTEDFTMRAYNDSNAVIFDSDGNPVAKICIEKNRYYNESYLQETDDFELDRNRNWSHYLLLVDGETYGHVAEYVHSSGYGSLHIACKDLDVINKIVETLDKRAWGGGSWSVNVG